MKYLNAIQERYELLTPLKIRLFIGMLIAANTAAIAILLACKFADFELTYNQALALFLISRVCLFMSNPQMKLTDDNVKIMSSERTTWNVTTMQVIIATWAIVSAAWLIQKLINIITLMI